MVTQPLLSSSCPSLTPQGRCLHLDLLCPHQSLPRECTQRGLLMVGGITCCANSCPRGRQEDIVLGHIRSDSKTFFIHLWTCLGGQVVSRVLPYWTSPLTLPSPPFSSSSFFPAKNFLPFLIRDLFRNYMCPWRMLFSSILPKSNRQLVISIFKTKIKRKPNANWTFLN